MPRYVIERDIPEIGTAERDALREASQKSNSVLAAMKAENKNIQWEHSYVAGDKTFCIYIADNPELIDEHAERSGFPASEVTLVQAHDRPGDGGGGPVVGPPAGRLSQRDRGSRRRRETIIAVARTRSVRLRRSGARRLINTGPACRDLCFARPNGFALEDPESGGVARCLPPDTRTSLGRSLRLLGTPS